MSYTANLEIDNEDFLTLSLNGVEFYCPYSKSSNSQYILAFDDRDAVSGRGGHRENGKGCYFLIKDHAIIVIGQLERPNDGKVANNGNFIINDWLFENTTKSIAYVFKESGEQIVRKLFKANLLTNALSESGQFAAFITCNSSLGDNNVIILYDLITGKQVWRKYFGFQNPQHITLSDNEKIELNYKDDKKIVLDWNFKQV